MYNEQAHEKVCRAAIKSMEMRMPVRLGGRPYETDDPFMFVSVRCSEPVIEALQLLCPLKWDRLVDVTMGIGAGFSNMGEVCGVVTGAVIGIGLDLSSRYRDTVLLRYYTIKFTQKFMRDCIKEFGGVRCRDLIGTDISGTLIPGDEAYASHLKKSAQARLEGIESVCLKLTRWAIMYPLPSEQEELYPPQL